MIYSTGGVSWRSFHDWIQGGPLLVTSGDMGAPINSLCKWVTGVVALLDPILIGVKTPFITGTGQPCKNSPKKMRCCHIRHRPTKVPEIVSPVYFVSTDTWKSLPETNGEFQPPFLSTGNSSSLHWIFKGFAKRFGRPSAENSVSPHSTHGYIVPNQCQISEVGINQYMYLYTFLKKKVIPSLKLT